MPQFDNAERFLKNPPWISEICTNEKLEKAIKTAEALGIKEKIYSDVWEVMKQLFT